MLIFWTIAAILTGLALLFIILPLLKKSTLPDQNAQNALNKRIYQQKLAELQEEDMTEEQRAEAKLELDRSVLQDLRNNSQVTYSQARWAPLLVILLLPVFAVGSYLQVGTPELNTVQALQPPTTPSSLPPNFEEMVKRLATRLKTDTQDEEGWKMLARSYAVLGDYEKTTQTYNQVLARFGENPAVLVELAEFIARTNQDELAGLPSLLIKQALELQPDFQDGLWLAGFAAAQQHNYAQAITHWQHLLQQLPADEHQTRPALEKHIAEAQKELKLQTQSSQSPSDNRTNPVPTKTLPSSSDLADSPVEKEAMDNPVGTTTEAESVPTVVAGTIQGIEVVINLEPTLQAQVTGEDTLFVYARALTGPPMPLAIIKTKVAEFPMTISLDDSLSIVPSMKLSNFEEVTVIARISKSGSAALQTGDLQGQVSPVKVGQQQQVNVLINEVVP